MSNSREIKVEIFWAPFLSAQTDNRFVTSSEFDPSFEVFQTIFLWYGDMSIDLHCISMNRVLSMRCENEFLQEKNLNDNSGAFFG